MGGDKENPAFCLWTFEDQQFPGKGAHGICTFHLMDQFFERKIGSSLTYCERGPGPIEEMARDDLIRANVLS